MRKWGTLEAGLRLFYWQARWYELLTLSLVFIGSSTLLLFTNAPTYPIAVWIVLMVLLSVWNRYIKDLLQAFGLVPKHRKRVYYLILSPLLFMAFPIILIAGYSDGFEASFACLGLLLAGFTADVLFAFESLVLRWVGVVIYFGFSVYFIRGDEAQLFSWQSGALGLAIFAAFLLWVSRSTRFPASSPERRAESHRQGGRLRFSSSSSETQACLSGLFFEAGGWIKMLLPCLLGTGFVIGGFFVWFLLVRDQDAGSWTSTLRYFGAGFIEPSIGARIQVISLIACMSFWAVLGIPRWQTSLLYPFSRKTQARSAFVASLSLSLSYSFGMVSTFLLLFIGTQGLDFEAGRLVKFLLPILQVSVAMIVLLPFVQWSAVRRQGKVTGASAFAFMTLFVGIGSVVFNLNLDTSAFARFLGFCAVLGLVSHGIYWQRLHGYYRGVDLVVQ